MLKQEQLGNKAFNLYRLKKIDCNVPAFITVTLKESQSPSIKKLLTKRLNKLFKKPPPLFVIRSSAKAEDQAGRSYAGQYCSEVAVKPAGIYMSVKRVAASLKKYKTSGSIIVQECIPCSVAGIIFTDAGDGNVVIEANAGLCTTVVAGKKADAYICNKQGIVISKKLAKDKIGQFIKKNSLVDKMVSTKEVLTAKQILTLCQAGKKIHQEFGSSQDIEWGYVGDRLYILQARPITQKLVQEQTFFDSANIAESYSGIVLPLTFSFAKEIYLFVYQDLLVASGVPKSLIKKHFDVFKNLLGHFYGRLYYNMNNWYQMMAFLPGYKRNKRNLEQMITSSISQDVDLKIKPSWWLRFRYPILVISKIFSFNRTINKFETDIKALYKKVNKKLNSNPNLTKTISLYQELHQNMLRRWYVTVENDFLVMSYFGILKKLVKDNKILLPYLHFDNISAQQIQMLKTLSEKVFSDKRRLNLFKQRKFNDLESQVKKEPKLNKMLTEYLSVYGGRFASELKLESPDISENPETLFSLMHRYTTQSQPIQKSKINKKRGLELKGFKRYLFFMALKRFCDSAKKREELRLLRSKAFSIIRNIFNRIGKHLKKRGVIETSEDIFYLETQEIFEIATSNNINSNWREKIKQRKKKYDGFREIKVRPSFSCNGTQPAPKDIILGKQIQGGELKLMGQPCSPGIVTGTIKILRDFCIPKNKKIEIIVAKHTDPGWTPIIGLAKGMIIEQGGLLSHASIVSRELGIPTVIGVNDALDKLKDGQIVTLDGLNGTVVIHDDNHIY